MNKSNKSNYYSVTLPLVAYFHLKNYDCVIQPKVSVVIYQSFLQLHIFTVLPTDWFQFLRFTAPKFAISQ